MTLAEIVLLLAICALIVWSIYQPMKQIEGIAAKLTLHAGGLDGPNWILEIWIAGQEYNYSVYESVPEQNEKLPRPGMRVRLNLNCWGGVTSIESLGPLQSTAPLHFHRIDTSMGRAFCFFGDLILGSIYGVVIAAIPYFALSKISRTAGLVIGIAIVSITAAVKVWRGQRSWRPEIK